MRGNSSGTRAGSAVFAFMMIAAFFYANAIGATDPASPLVGIWQAGEGQASYTLILNADGKGSLNGHAVEWQYSNGVLHMKAATTALAYKASFTPSTLALTGNDLREPLVFRRVDREAAVVLPAPPGAAERLPIPGNPPLDSAMVEKGTRFFEWLLDARLTEEQAQQFRDSLVRSWKSRNQDEIAGTLGVLKFHDELGRRSEAERNTVREALQSKYLESMRATPNNPLAKWVLDIYYSAHTPIAGGNPPLTRQVADAYAEVNCFMVSEVLGGQAFKPGREFKDKLAATLVAGYASLPPERQQEYSRLPFAWAAIRFAWPTLSEAERSSYRREWAPGIRAMLADPTAASAAARTSTPQQQADSRSAMQKLQTHMQTQRMLFNMNQDYIHKYVLKPGWTYQKYSW